MCGRFALFATQQEIVSHFSLQAAGFSMRPRYNIAPRDTIPIIDANLTQIEFCRWGFLPSWARDKGLADAGYINARLESVLEKPSFKKAMTEQRCLIPASGYYEWKEIKGKKQPFFFYLKGQSLLAFAGIWSTWQSEEGVTLKTCAILTQPASESLLPFHERMPVIVAPAFYKTWLAIGVPADLPSLFIKLDEKNLTFRAVTIRMSNPKFEGAECIQPL